MPKTDKSLLLPYYRRQELKDLNEFADQPVKSKLRWAGGGAAIGAPLGGLLGLAHTTGSFTKGLKSPATAVGAAVGGLGAGMLGYLIAKASNSTKAESQAALALPKRQLSQHLHDAAVARYLEDLYGLEEASSPKTNVTTHMHSYQ